MRRPAHTAVSLAVIALLGVSTLAQAQFGVGRSAQRTYPDNLGMTGAPPIATQIAALVLERSAELGLSDGQNLAIAAIRQTQDSVNAPRLKTLDSLRPTRRPANGPNDLSQEQRDEMEARRGAITQVLDELHKTNIEARGKVIALLTPDQQKRAEKLEEDAQKRADDEAKRRSRDVFGNDRGRTRVGRQPED